MNCLNYNPGPLPGLVSLAFGILELLILARVLLSWFPISPWHPVSRWLHRIVDPILRPFRRILPTFGGMDFSPMLALATVYVLQSVVNNLLLSCGISPVNAVLSVVRAVVLGIIIVFCVITFIRVLFSLFHADPLHPIVMGVRRITDPLVRPFAAFVPRGAAVEGGAAIAFVVFLALYFLGAALFNAAGVY
jgi:YggT family protein